MTTDQITCKGCHALGTACGACARCANERWESVNMLVPSCAPTHEELLDYWRARRTPDPASVRMIGELRPGAMYALRVMADGPKLPELMKQLSDYLDTVNEITGCKFVVLGPGLEFVEPKEAEDGK